METLSPPPALTNGTSLHFAAMEAPPLSPPHTNGDKSLPSVAMETPPPSPALTHGNKLPSAAMETPPPSPALTNGNKLPFAAMVPHILLVSIPAPGHILPFSKFADKLAASGYKVTCVSTGHVLENLRHGGHDVQGKGTNVTSQRIRFQPLLEEDEDEVPTVKLEMMKDWMQKLSDKEMQVKLEEFIERLSPTPCCIVADMFVGWVQDAADKFGIPKHTLFTMPASSLASALMALVLVEQGKLPFRGDRHNFVLVPGSITLYVEDIWDSFKEPDHKHFDFHFKNIKRLKESDTIFINTFDELESAALESMRSDTFAANVKVPRLVPIGPLVPDCAWEGEALAVNYENEKSEAERWLDTQDAHSVLYISFGSLATISSEEQITELALALEASPCPFLWVYRPPGLPQVNKLVDDTAPPTGNECIPPGFEERTRGRGMLIKGWAPQLQILLHKSTGAFLSHCGWNSTLESICTGVPMLTWPFWADQKTNARFIVDTAKIGLRFNQHADGMIKQSEIERVVAQMMDGEEGKSARRNILELQQLARSSVADSGSSRENFEKSLNNICPMPTSSTSPCQCTKPKVQAPQV